MKCLDHDVVDIHLCAQKPCFYLRLAYHDIYCYQILFEPCSQCQGVSAGAKLPRHKLTLTNANTDAKLSLAITKSEVHTMHFFIKPFQINDRYAQLPNQSAGRNRICFMFKH